MKIAFLLPKNSLSGGTFVTYIQALALQNKGHTLSLLFEEYDRTKKGSSYFEKLPIETLTLAQAEAQNREFDIVIASWWRTFFSIFRLRAKHHFYFCQSDERRFYGDFDFFYRHFVAFTYSFPQVGIITEAKWIKNMLESEFSATVEYAPNGVDLEKFSPKGPKVKEKSKRLRVLIEGPGSVPLKRVEDAFMIANAVSDIEVWHVSSDGHVKAHWRYDRLFKQVPYNEMGAIYRSCDLLIKVSAVEGFFGPPLEMMACGGTAIVSQVTGYDEYILDGVNALVVPIGDVKKGIDALEKLKADRAYLERLSKNGLETAKKMSWDLQTPQFEKALQTLMQKLEPVPLPVQNLIRSTGTYLSKSLDAIKPGEMKILIKTFIKEKLNAFLNADSAPFLKQPLSLLKFFLHFLNDIRKKFPKFVWQNKLKFQFFLRTILLQKKLRAEAKAKNSPFFSVVIPIYDAQEDLKTAIESVLKQSFRNFELLLICDGSPEEILKIVKVYESYPSVRTHFFKDNSGNACRGRNKGIQMAKGQYIAFLDSDDVALPNRLRDSFIQIISENADLLAGSARLLIDGSRIIPGLKHLDIAYPENLSLSKLEEVNPFITSTVAVRRDLLLKLGGFRRSMLYREDHELWLRLLAQGAKISLVPKVISEYRIHRNNTELRFKATDEHWHTLARNFYRTVCTESDWSAI